MHGQVITYNDFIYTQIVTVGWQVIRDVSNLFFVLILIAIAIGTILNVDTYNYRRLLPRLILMAILINFSKTICGLLIDFAQVVMYQFSSVISATGAQQLYLSFGIQKLFTIVKAGQNVDISNSIRLFDVVVGLSAGFIFLLIATIVIFVYLVVFVFRIVMLWILIVLSPFAFLLAAWPGGKAQGLSREWWSKFTEYVITGPLLMFFFWLALTTSSIDQGLNLVDASAGAKTGAFEGSFISQFMNPSNLARFIVITFLVILIQFWR